MGKNVALEDEEDVTATMDQVMDQPDAESIDQGEVIHQDDAPEATPAEETKVPLSALTKTRKRAQEAESKAKWLEEQYQNLMRQGHQPPTTQEEDTSAYETVTKADLNLSQLQTERIVKETVWIHNNPEKAQHVDALLEDFLNQRPNLRSAISQSANRYEEAYLLMTALTPKQQAQIKPAATKREVKPAPGSPGGITKSAALSEAVDIMSMSDSEFNTWRAQQKKRR